MLQEAPMVEGGLEFTKKGDERVNYRDARVWDVIRLERFGGSTVDSSIITSYSIHNKYVYKVR